ncbi:MAG: hypothetical protein AB7I41_16950 [Candidatus Sericytochromatia bacterium]
MKGLLKFWQGLRPVLGLFLVLHLQSCAVTVYNWSEIPNKDWVYGYSVEDRLTTYRRYAIRELNDHLQGMSFSTWEQPDKYYNLNSYAPVIYSLLPEAEKIFESGQYWGNFSRMADFLFYTAGSVSIINAYDDIIAGNKYLLSDIESKSNLFESRGVIFLLTVLVTSSIAFYLDFREIEEYEKIKSAYNEALRKELGLSEAQILDLVLPQTEP